MSEGYRITSHDDDNFARAKYIKLMRSRCGRYERSFKDSPMNDLNADTYVQQKLGEWVEKVDKEEGDRSPEKPGEGVPRPQRPPRKVLEEQQREFHEAVKNHRQVVVIGRAGRGKTSLLYWAVQSGLNELEDDETARVPIYVPLKEVDRLDKKLSKPVTLVDCLQSMLGDEADQRVLAWIQKQVTRGNTLLLLDALDEVPRNSRSQFLSTRGKIAGFVRSLESPQSRIVLTCRDAVYSELQSDLAALQLPGRGKDNQQGFAKMELKRFTQDQIVSYAERYFGNETAESFLKDIEDPRGGSSRYTHLAEEPLYLHMLCWLWAGSDDAEASP